MDIDERDRDKTAFVTMKGQWYLKVHSFGLCNSLSQFACIMELVLSGIMYDMSRLSRRHLGFLQDL